MTACFVCGGLAAQRHHILVPQERQYRKYPEWIHHRVNICPVCVQCHMGNGRAKNFTTRQRWIAAQDKQELLAWLDAAPEAARYRVDEIRRMVNAEL